MSESAVSAKRVWGSLARNRRSPKRPSEPRPSGVHPEETEWKKLAKPSVSRRRIVVRIGIQHTGGTRGNSQCSVRGIFD